MAVANGIKGKEKRALSIELLFVDPPYSKTSFYDLVGDIVEKGLMSETGFIVCEHEKMVDLPDAYGDFQLSRRENYGGTVISIYRHQAEEENSNE